uniref:pantothenate kinase n=1 Tax=Steinernema glaseri TaxID=37863 RepID=A0A1I8AIT4_9BILA
MCAQLSLFALYRRRYLQLRDNYSDILLNFRNMTDISKDDIEHFLSNLERRASSSVSPFSELPMPWFGLDIGGTLTKLVYFEPTDDKSDFETEEELLSDRMIQRYLTTNKAYGDSGIRDEHLELQNVTMNNRMGTIHFIRFPTTQMPTFISLVKEKSLALMSSTVCATGGGAVKYAKDAESQLNMSFHKSDELESLIKGIELVAAANPEECYYYDNPLNDKCRKITWRWSRGCCSSMCIDHSQLVQDGLQYPYMVVNIGSGVSVMAVHGPQDFERISGSSIGGGFFQGLCCLLCGCETFEEAVMLASKGNNKNIDKLVKDIYGRGYDNVGLPEDTVAASFGKICSIQARENATREDLAHAALVTTTNNIGSVALNAANLCNIDRIVFVGNFLRVNPIAARLLSNAMDYWSRGSKKALFLQHEGYFGAVGCLDKLVAVTEMRKKQRESCSPSPPQNTE